MKDGDCVSRETCNSGPGELNNRNQFERQWHFSALVELDEPNLCEVSNDRARRAYRFLYLPSFGFPIAVRLEIFEDGSGEVHVKRHLGYLAIRVDEPVEYKRVPVEPQDADTFLREVDLESFWTLPPEIEVWGFDGSRWIIEGADQGEYHVVDRWSPQSGAAWTLGMKLLEMSGVELPEGSP